MRTRNYGLCLLLLASITLPPDATAQGDQAWVDFAVRADKTDDQSPIDLRYLNEKVAGQSGRVHAKAGRFILGSGEPVRFWGVNGPSHEASDEDIKAGARLLAKYGVNLVRYHGAIFNDGGETDFEKIRRIQFVVSAMKTEGIYTHLSVYFPLWFRPPADLEWLPGYDGQQHPFASLIFNPQFQQKHRQWLKDLLTTPAAEGGLSLMDEPAVLGIEIQNEDSLFFWTFDEKKYSTTTNANSGSSIRGVVDA